MWPELWPELWPGIVLSAAIIWALVGLAVQVVLWLRSRSDRTLALMPAPDSVVGVVARLCLEIVFFRALWRASRVTWAGCAAMHYGLLVVLLMHLRFVFEVPPQWVLTLIAWSGWASMLALAGICLLFLRRCLVDRIRYISTPGDYGHLLLLAALLLSGLVLKRIWPTELYQVGQFLRGAVGFNWQALPVSAALLTHLMIAVLLLLIFPVSKLLHAPGIVLTPTLTQRGKSGRAQPEQPRGTGTAG